MKYVIKGEPTGVVGFQEYSTWSEGKALRLNYGMQLKNQHDDKPLLHGKLGVDITFYFLAPINTKKNKNSGSFHIDSPSIGSLIKVIEDLGRGAIFSNNSHIAQISASKYYDNNPRTEITFCKLKESDEKD